MSCVYVLPVICYTHHHGSNSRRMAQRSRWFLCLFSSLHPVHSPICYVLAQHNKFWRVDHLPEISSPTKWWYKFSNITIRDAIWWYCLFVLPPAPGYIKKHVWFNQIYNAKVLLKMHLYNIIWYTPRMEEQKVQVVCSLLVGLPSDHNSGDSHHAPTAWRSYQECICPKFGKPPLRF